MENQITTLHQVSAVLGYLLGSIPFGLVLTRLAGLGDIRAIGSGNIGATNVLRTGNKALAVATLLLDGGKGAAAALAAGHVWGQDAAILAGLFAVFGHNFPIWLKFQGGKGVATTLGTLMALAWPVGVAACVTWLSAAFLFRYSSLSALIALAASPVFTWVFTHGDQRLTVAVVLLALLGIARHHANIRRLLKGEEPKIGTKKD